MAERYTLGIEFMRSRPAAAAGALGAMDPGEAAPFLEAVPARVAAVVLARMSSWQAAALVARLSADAGAGLVRNLAYADAAAILRLVPTAERGTLIEALPSRLAADFERSMSYPDDTVGAHMTLQILAFSPTDTVEAARDGVRRSGVVDADVVFVLDDDHRLVGMVTAVSLLRFAERTLLGDIVEVGVETLSARAGMQTVRDLDSWDLYAMLPVSSRRGQVIGALTRRAARRSGDAGAVAVPAGREPGLLVELLDTLYDTLAGPPAAPGSPGSPPAPAATGEERP